jgi:hypothetical protein
MKLKAFGVAKWSVRGSIFNVEDGKDEASFSEGNATSLSPMAMSAG